jgi:hypothetical protein
MSEQPYPGYEGSVGPFPRQYGKPHVYARDVHSGAGNCVCGRDPRHRLHPELAPGVPNPECRIRLAELDARVRVDSNMSPGTLRVEP